MEMKQTNAASPKDIEFVEYYGFNECGWSGIAPASSTAPSATATNARNKYIMRKWNVGDYNHQQHHQKELQMIQWQCIAQAF